MAQLRNEVRASGEKRREARDSEVLVGTKRSANNKEQKDAQAREERDKLRKREHKSLMKSLNMAQLSTASMGKFDRKAGKNEPEAPKSQKI